MVDKQKAKSHSKSIVFFYSIKNSSLILGTHANTGQENVVCSCLNIISYESGFRLYARKFSLKIFIVLTPSTMKKKTLGKKDCSHSHILSSRPLTDKIELVFLINWF